MSSLAALSERLLARRLVLDGAQGPDDLDGGIRAANQVLERLRSVTVPLIGASGYAALLGRSLALAQPGARCLEAVPSAEGGRVALAGSGPGTQPPEPAEVREAAIAVVASVISLLVTFIGEDLTRRALQRGWPDLEFTTHASDDDQEETSDE